MVAYERNTGSQHPLIGGIEISSTGKRDTGRVPLTDYYADLWYGTVFIGTPAKRFTGVTLFSSVSKLAVSDFCAVLYIVDFDTGSSDLFVPSENCDSSCSGHNAYDPHASSTAHDLGKTFTLTYGDGSAVSGEEYGDNVIIAGLVVR